MTAADLLSVICAVLALAAAATLSLLATRALRAARQLEDATRIFTEQAIPAVEELRVAAGRATSEVDRIDDLLDLAASIGDRVDSATEATYRALTSPVIKGVAFASGTRRAADRLRGRGRPTTTGGRSAARALPGDPTASTSQRRRSLHRSRSATTIALPEERTTR